MYKCLDCNTKLIVLDKFSDCIYKCPKCKNEYLEDQLVDDPLVEEV